MGDGGAGSVRHMCSPASPCSAARIHSSACTADNFDQSRTVTLISFVFKGRTSTSRAPKLKVGGGKILNVDPRSLPLSTLPSPIWTPLKRGKLAAIGWWKDLSL